MLNIRVIPCLLWRGDGLIKTVKFKNPVYVGDAINAIRIFNEKEVDELVILDVEASKKRSAPDIAFIKRIASECFMPLCYGGGITSLQQIKEVVAAGVEKVCMNSMAVQDPSFVKQASKTFGSSTIVACIDYKTNLFGKPFVTFTAGQNKSKYNPVDFACLMEEMGAGEIVMNSIERDGTMNGYDVEMLAAVTEKVSVPVIALGGAGKIDHFEEVISHSKVSAVAAGSMFVFQGIHKAVLINYPSQKNLERLNAIHQHS